MSLREAGVSLFDCEHRTPPAQEHGYPYVGIPQVKNGRIDLEGVRQITSEHYDEWTRKAKPEPFDVVLSRRCNPGETGFVANGIEFALGQNLVLLRADETKIIKPFLRWLVRGPQWWEQVGKYINVGAVFDSLKCADIPEFQLQIPPIPEQRAIAHILGTLDDKIELNRRMNETLEAMARALFKSWFVDFDPVRAKMAGRDPGLPQPLANLFPDRLVNSELGEIPEGWEVGMLREVVEQLRDPENPQSIPDTLFSHHSIPAYDQGKLPIREYGTDIRSTKSRLQPGVVLLSKLNPEIERVWLVDVEPGERAICSTEFLVLSPRPPFQRSYVYCLARSPVFREQVGALVTGTSKSHQRAQAGAVLSLEAIIPSAPVVHAFEQQASAVLNKSLGRRRETSTLVGLRDSLLPRLVSREIRVGDAKKEIGGSL